MFITVIFADTVFVDDIHPFPTPLSLIPTRETPMTEPMTDVWFNIEKEKKTCVVRLSLNATMVDLQKAIYNQVPGSFAGYHYTDLTLTRVRYIMISMCEH